MRDESAWVSVSMPYVTPLKPGDPEVWADEAARQGGVGSQRLLGVAELMPSPDVATALQLAPDELVVVRRRMILLDDRPVELSDSYYPASIARGSGLAETRKIRGGAITLLTELGYRAHQIIEDVSARPATSDESVALELAEGEWVLNLTRLLTTESGVPFEVSVMTMTAPGRRLRYQLSIGDEGDGVAQDRR